MWELITVVRITVVKFAPQTPWGGEGADPSQ